MKNFIGIDLGTTNSAICSYDGSETRIWKSPEQNDVTPSAIYIDRRGNKYVGKRAYDLAPGSPDNSAILFKRLMGTSTPVELTAVNLTKTPEECSAEVLKVLFGYLPEEIRNNPDTGTVITVPAAFNQMQKDATMHAAEIASLGKVALMQEPVAAVMSAMRTRNTDGIFLIYDLGGGTLDIAIAESIGGRVNLLAHGGIAMCGGRDFDRVLMDNVVRPWLLDNFDLPEDFSVNPNFKRLIRMATWATERAKIELSAREDSVISLAEHEVQVRDLNGDEIYLDIPLQRTTYDELIADRIKESIDSARETLNKAGLTPHDLERIVFIGGPPNYKPLRDKVAFELGIPANTDVNPMTAVAEGASLFAESIDWNSRTHSRKNTRGQISAGGELGLSFNYIARTPALNALIAIQVTDLVAAGFEFQIDSMDTGWSSGRLPLKHGTTINVTLPKNGDNIFKAFVFDSAGGPIALEQDRIVITRTAATVDAIPASHSIGIEILEKLGGRPVLDYLIRSGDSLPQKGKKIFKAAQSLKAGAPDSLNFKIWEGDIEDPITDNRPIGAMKISGSDFNDGVIHAGADLECEFEILDSGNIILEISVPCVGGTFHSGKNFYSRQEGQIDYSDATLMVIEEAQGTLYRLNEISEVINDPKLNEIRQKLESTISLDLEQTDTEKTQEAMEKVHEARRLLDQIRRLYLNKIRTIDLEKEVSFFNKHLRQHARPSEASTFDNLVKTAQRSINQNDRDFEHLLHDLKVKSYWILRRQDWFIIKSFKSMLNSPHLFIDKQRFKELVDMGTNYMHSDEIDKLRGVLRELYSIRIRNESDTTFMDVTNIIRG